MKRAVRVWLKGGGSLTQVYLDQGMAVVNRDSLLATVSAAWNKDAFDRSITLIPFGDARFLVDDFAAVDIVDHS